MKLKLASAAAIALMLAGGAALAQSATTAAPDTTQSDKLHTLEDPAMTGPFFTDDTMTTMRSDEEMKTAWAAMSAENQKMLKEQCATTESVKFKEFCGKISAM
ncbi:hypothetical protein EET67_16770 [Pseudaminobacter arsenicus]|uniref:Acid-shock protein n=1 Tax=Borborobacter arsenicus TaxID=1851146 RepID=A0A432V3F4_9HYPH|nr:hypothetical protein [Pseudaminobacter arsenicus]RUM96638.1 hypothetical protein EET67_16770 [Pseudaminobacter arsenicus]